MRPLVLCSAYAVFLIGADARADDWTPITDPDEVAAVMNDAAFVMKKTVTSFYRADGNMVEHNADYDLTAIRKWAIEDSGEICRYVFVKPDHQIDCIRISKASDGRAAYTISWPIDNTTYPLTPLSSAPADLVDALDAAVAGQ